MNETELAGGAKYPKSPYPSHCPECGRFIEMVTRGQRSDDGPVMPTTYWPCGHSPEAYRLDTPNSRVDN